MIDKLLVILYMMLAGVLIALGDYYSKKWSLQGYDKLNIIIAYALYALSPAFWFLSFKLNSKLAEMTVVWVVMNILAATFIGLYIFGEQLSVTQWSGVALSVAGIILILV